MKTLILASLFALGALAQETLITRLDHVTVFVKDYDEALKWYTETLGFEKTADQAFGKGQRWLTVAPRGQKGSEIVLAKADGQHTELVGKQALWVFHTTDCQKTYEALRARGVKFRQPPAKVGWGGQAIFEDLYGNEFVLLSDK
jgi:predicted enzyme related to lactoylglutathione lyase